VTKRALPTLAVVLATLPGGVGLAGIGCAGAAPVAPPFVIRSGVTQRAPNLDRPLAAAERRWVEATIASLTLRQKVAQMVSVQVRGMYQHPRAAGHLELLRTIRELEPGGVILSTSELETAPRFLNELQAASRLPLLVSSDLERGVAFRVHDGAVPVPYAMALGAARSAEAAARAGEVTAREGRAVGIHWALAPVVDVNSNPANPVINLRSFGEDPVLVARLAAAFVRGARRGGMLTTAKHFPGHGDTDTDSHLDLPVVDADRERLDALEWVPFRAAIEAGVDGVMLAHVAVPAVDPSGAPATLSPILGERALRDELGFRGLLVTDALDMEALKPLWTGGAAERAVLAGADVLLMPDHPVVAVDAVVRAVAEGRIPERRIDASVRRLLEHKARLGLHEHRFVAPDAFLRQVGRPDDLGWAEEAAAAAITVVRNDDGTLPLAADEPLDLLHLVLSSDFADPWIRGIPEAALETRRIPAETRHVGPDLPDEVADRIVAAASGRTHVLASVFARVRSGKGRVDMDPSHAALLERLAGAGVPLVVVSYGSPYLLTQMLSVPVYVAAFGPVESSQRAAMRVVFGEVAAGGRLPVTIPGLHAFGHGLDLPRHDMALERTEPQTVGFRPGALAEVGRILEGFRARGAFPGGVAVVGRRGRLAWVHPFGTLTWDEGSPAVTADTIYDLASLTKVVATTSMAMMLVDEGRLDLDARVVDFLPAFRGGGKEEVTVRHLLTHSSGIGWWAPLYEELRGQDVYVARIVATDLASAPGSRTRYSDLGLILLGEVLERVAGESLESFVERRVFAPLGMADTGFRPDPSLRHRIAPTEEDPWRGRLLHGEVHDENAYALGGVAPHAGLFGTARDLAAFAQAMLHGGVYDHHRLASREIVERFTTRAGLPGSDRALGWDTKSAAGSSAGDLFSRRSFGHLGFTGTSLWIDPDRELFLILLTNRVHPTRENDLVREARPAVADAVIRALEDPSLPEPADGMRPVVRTGLDRVASGEDHGLRGRRVGLVAHAASVTGTGVHAIEALRASGAELVRVFAPEHGLRGRAAAGEVLADELDERTGLPVVSLYGASRKPRLEDLADLDALVFDLQGAGVRFYTYVSTMLLSLEAAAEAGIDFVVLDRPNPLGGERIEGPMSAPRDVVPESFVNMAPGPLVHGMTMGEMARYVNARRERPARLTVVPMEGWRRWMTWVDTGLPWVSPSPNLRSPEAAVAYPGVGLLEATELSEGRGTEIPFLRFGAPWIDPGDPGPTAPGFVLQPTAFVPRGSRVAPDPPYEGQTCHGWHLEVSDRRAARPYALGVALLDHLLDRYPQAKLRESGALLTRLLGTPRPTESLLGGESVEAILAADAEDHDRWQAERASALLYE
jgi:beta-glucosidase-like glycosyl hydrolase/uncharacterized protein YbbC (DUF1343 family)